ncbi:PREDICTED: asialoglycoprotein receptor 1-like [Thamnophis sirtalis]|uniref:Asialoglycoprotein receptor 1-like n=1 Tax=Thamnophis sirtalis TaxID=35019 RepID=A0A6I9YZ55_9SAUR|nr:PREDICTED: asialoglycoprotein receptor 1-like [Thamnophis sirtalis]XP_013929166.1 PREDICTED: asialoglycoprotein receptor 1-like [Thamnophis sirtalis]
MGGFAHQDSLRQRLCSGRRLILILMGLLAVVILSLVMFGFLGRKYSATLGKMQEDVKTSNRTLAAVLVDFQQQEANYSEDLQKVDRLVKQNAEGKEAMSHFQDQIKKLQETFKKINCALEDVKHKREAGGCCPRGWHLFQRSCYWLSPTLTTWAAAKGDCEEKNAHLVVLTNYLEKQFVLRLIKPHSPWIGLKYNGEMWKWVDGTTYTKRRIDWRPTEPNQNSVFCTVMHPDGLWGDAFCRVELKWVCEMPAQG